jgi:hypothetical protein
LKVVLEPSLGASKRQRVECSNRFRKISAIVLVLVVVLDLWSLACAADEATLNRLKNAAYPKD